MVGRLLASGREADVYEIDAGRVLRRYRLDRDVHREASVMRAVAGLGYPMAAVAGELLPVFLRVAPGDPRRLLGEAAKRRRGQVDTLTADEIAGVERAVELICGQ